MQNGCLHKAILPENPIYSKALTIHECTCARSFKVGNFHLWDRMQLSVGHQSIGLGTPIIASAVKEGLIAKQDKSYNLNTLCKEWQMEDAVGVLHNQRGVRGDSKTYTRLLQGCVKKKALAEGKRIHAHMVESGFEPDISLWNNLINMYVKCGRIDYACQVFNKMPERDMVSWTVIIGGYARDGFGKEALRIFNRMLRENVKPGQFTFASVLRACTNITGLEQGKEIHSHIVKYKYDSDISVGNALVTMYAKCGCIDSACQVFDKMPKRDVVSWTAMITGYVQNEHEEEALILFYRMLLNGIPPDPFTFAIVLKACASLASLEYGKQAHSYLIKAEFKLDVSVENSLIDMYSKCGNMVDARQVFDKMLVRDKVSWNTIIVGCAQHEHAEETLELFCQMHHAGMKLDDFTFTSILRACSSLGALQQGREVHNHTIRTGFISNVFVASALIDMYAKCSSIKNAHKVFASMSNRIRISWNAMVGGCVLNGYGEEALKLFSQMQRLGMNPDEFIITSVLKVCANLVTVDKGKELHSHIIKNGFESDIFVGSALIDMYAKCGSINKARKMFDKMPERNVVSWSAMIAGYSQNGCSEHALKLFYEMHRAFIKPNQFTFTSVLVACAILAVLGKGKELHGLIIKTGFESDVSVGNTLIDMYAKCGSIGDACKVFDKIPNQDVVSWNAMIAGYAQCELGEVVTKLFCQMQWTGNMPDQFTVASVIGVCANQAFLEHGKQVHTYIIKTGFESDICVANALVDMYSKCGSMVDASKCFDEMPERNVVSWTTMIAGCAQHGHGKKALQLFEQMQRAGMKPNDITFVCVLSACSHVGLVREAHRYFDSMNRDHGVMPRVEHYACMVDVLGRAGHLDDAEDFINKMPFEPNALIWRTLLGACRIHGNMQLGKHVAERLLELEPQDSATYVLLSNIYAAGGRWDDAARVRRMMEERGVKKEPGYSWIEVKNRVHTFLVKDRSHPLTEEIYAKLEELNGQMKDVGYVPDRNFVLHDVEDAQKEHFLCHHSEKLAIAFGLISTPPQKPIRIVKNLRVCGDCHTASKFISKLTNRELVVRDSNRFHHFKDGKCSCGDYW
eukprot:Gb_14867 [translate_table: standard]